MKEIYDFQAGDEIVRVEPAKPYQSGIRDRSYTGKKLILLNIINGQIYLRRTDEADVALFGDSLISLDLDMWDEGWDMWRDPTTLSNNTDEWTLHVGMDVETIKQLMKEAIEDEDYERAGVLKEKLNKS